MSAASSAQSRTNEAPGTEQHAALTARHSRNRATRDWSIVAALLIIATAARLFLLAKADWMADYDESVIGLMAIDVTKGSHPYFFYGQPYLGALEAYSSAILFLLFGVSRQALKITPLAMGILYVLITYWLARQSWGRRPAALAGLVAALAPLYVLTNTLKAGAGATAEVLPLGGLILLCTLNAARAPADVRRALWWAALGFAVGLSFWLHWLLLYYVLAALVFLILRRPAFLLKLDSWPAIPALLLGSAPLLYYNYRHDWVSFHYFLEPERPPASHLPIEVTGLDVAGNFFSQLVPQVLGATAPGPPWLAWAGALAATAVLVAFVVVCLARRAAVCPAGKLVLVFTLVVPALYLASGFGVSSLNRNWIDAAGRYVVPLFAAVPLSFAFLYHQAGTHQHRRLLVALAALLCLADASALASADGRQVLQSPYYNRAPASFAPVVDALRQEDIRHVWTDLGLGQPLMFQSVGEIKAADYLDRGAGGPVRFPVEYAAVDGAERTAYLVAVLPGSTGPLEEEFRRLSIPYHKRDIGNLALLVPERRVMPGEVAGRMGFQY